MSVFFHFQALLWLLLLTFSCSVEPVNFNSTCFCLCPASSPVSPAAVCVRLWLRPQLPLEGPCEPASAVNSHQCRPGMRRGPGPGRGHHSGGLEDGGLMVVVVVVVGRLSRCSVRGKGEEIMLMSRPPPCHPLWFGGVMDTKEHREPVGVCLSRGHHARSESHCEPLLY